MGVPSTPADIEASEHEPGAVPVQVIPVPLPSEVTPVLVTVVTAPFTAMVMPVPAAVEVVAVHVGIPESHASICPFEPPVMVIAEAEAPMTEMGFESETTPEAVSEEVAALEIVELLTTYVIWPAVHGVVLLSPVPPPTEEFIVIGVPPMVTKVVQVVPPVHVTDVVAVPVRRAGEPEVVVQYASWFAVSAVEVLTACVPPLPVPQLTPVDRSCPPA